MPAIIHASPIGPLELVSNGSALTRLAFAKNALRPQEAAPDAVLAACVRQLEAYFSGSLKRFDLPLELTGTPFQQRVWRALLDIPYGETRSYKHIALHVGSPGAFRAVGMANNKNPIAIIVPCHRVVGADGSLTGYAGGLDVKRRLLELEKNKYFNKYS